MRKMATLTKSRPARKTPKRRKSAAAKKSVRSRKKSAKKSALPPALAGTRPPPPGQGKRGEKGYLAYLLRQAQAATRLTMERALADLGVTPPQFAVLTMLKAYPGLSGADLARVALLTPQTVGVIIRNLERDRRDQKDPASRARKGAAMDPDPARRQPARQMPASRPGAGAAADGRAWRQGAGNGAALAVQNCHRPAAGWLVPAAQWLLPSPCPRRYNVPMKPV